MLRAQGTGGSEVPPASSCSVVPLLYLPVPCRLGLPCCDQAVEQRLEGFKAVGRGAVEVGVSRASQAEWGKRERAQFAGFSCVGSVVLGPADRGQAVDGTGLPGRATCEREGEPDHAFAGLLPRWSQWPELSCSETRSFFQVSPRGPARLQTESWIKVEKPGGEPAPTGDADAASCHHLSAMLGQAALKWLGNS